MCRYQQDNNQIRSNQTNNQIRELLRSEAITATNNQTQQNPANNIPASRLVSINELRNILAHQADDFDQNSTATTDQDDWSFTSATASESTFENDQ